MFTAAHFTRERRASATRERAALERLARPNGDGEHLSSEHRVAKLAAAVLRGSRAARYGEAVLDT